MTALNEPSPLVDVEALRALLGTPSLRVVDARFDLADADAGCRAFAASRIPGAVYAHLDDDLSDHAKPASEGRHPLPDAKRFAATLARWHITPATPVVVYDGGSGAMAANKPSTTGTICGSRARHACSAAVSCVGGTATSRPQPAAASGAIAACW